VKKGGGGLGGPPEGKVSPGVYRKKKKTEEFGGNAQGVIPWGKGKRRVIAKKNAMP